VYNKNLMIYPTVPLMSHWAEVTNTQSMRANDNCYSSSSNENDLREDFCDWSALITNSVNSTQWDIGNFSETELAKRNHYQESVSYPMKYLKGGDT